MVDTTAAKNHLQNTLSVLENTTTSWIRTLEQTVAHTAFELSSTLNNDDFFVSTDTLNSLNRILNYMNDTSAAWLSRKLDAEKSWLAWWTPAAITNAYNSLTTWAWHTNIDNRRSEISRLISEANKFEKDCDLGNVSDIIWRTTWAPIVLNLDWMTTVWNTADRYELCDKNWKPLRLRTDWTWDYYLINIWWRNVKLRGIRVVSAWASRRIEFQNVKFDPSDVDTSNPIDLSVNATYWPIPWAWNLKAVLNKPFSLKLNDSVAVRQADRENLINDFNTAWWDVIRTHINNVLEAQRNKLLRDAINRIVTRSWSTVFWTLTDEQKEDFYRRILDNNAPIPWFPPVTVWWSTINWLVDNINHLADFDLFKTWFANDARAWNKDARNTKSTSIYTTYIHDHFRWESENYFNEQLDNSLKLNPDTERYIKAQLSNYLVEFESNKRDNPTARNNVENNFETTESMRMRKDKWIWQWWKVRKFEPIRKKDNNYMRFFSWSSKEIKNQNVNLSSWTINYDIKLDINESNKPSVEIKMSGKEPIVIQSWDYDPATLARRILREPSIPENKARVHMVYNLYKWFLQLAKEKNIKLEYFDDSTWGWTMHELNINSKWNIILNSVNYTWVPPYTRSSTVLFDEQLFHNTNQFNTVARNNSLEEWITSIATHFTQAMDRLHSSYRRSIKRSLWRALQRWGKTELPTSFWTSPIRKLINMKNNTNFDFTTTVWEVNIELKKNTFTVATPKSPKPIVSTSLWKILNKRVKGKRIFDWVERDIVEAVYSNLIKKMRENSKVASTHFWVYDEVTGHVYVLDPSWHFWRINRDALNWRNIFNFWWDWWVISEKVFRWKPGRPGYTYNRLSATEEKELLKNPLLMQWLVKAMNRRMWIVESIRARFDRN